MTPTRAAFIMYPVTDVPRAVDFYENVVGLKKDGLEQPYWVEFDLGELTFGIGNFEQVGVAGTAQSLAIEVPDMTATRNELHGKSIATTEPFETPVCFISSFKDPDGNTIWLHQSKPH